MGNTPSWGNGNLLPYMNADRTTVTVSGHSAGCYMAERMMVINSATIKGAGLFTCWPYGIPYADIVATTPETATQLSARSIALIDARNSTQIDPPTNLANNAVYIYSAQQDTTTPPLGQEAQ